MPGPTLPRTWTIPYVVSGADLNTEIRDPANLRLQHQMIVSSTFTTSTVTATNTLLTWSSIPDWDGTGLTYNSTNGTIQIAVAGPYLVSTGGSFASNATGYRSLFIEKYNGTDPGLGSATMVRRYTTSPSSNQTTVEASRSIYLAAGDVLRVYVFQNSTSTLNFNTSADAWFSVQRIG